MERTEINYKGVFQLFVSDNNYRPELCQPFKRNGMQYATDGHAMIIMPIETEDLGFAEQDKPQAGAIVPKEEPIHELINISDLEAKLIPEMIEEIIEEEDEKDCDECDGEGVVEWEYIGKSKSYDRKDDCPCCDGIGTIEETKKTKTGKMIEGGNAIYRMNDVYYTYEQLKKLMTACKMMGVETITKTYGTKRQAGLFTCGQTKILVMPVAINEDCLPAIKIIN